MNKDELVSFKGNSGRLVEKTLSELPPNQSRELYQLLLRIYYEERGKEKRKKKKS